MAYDVNIRTVSAFREIGRGYAAIETFCGFMNMPPPMNKTTYQDIVDGMHISYTEAADESMKAAACELVEMAHEDNNEYDDGDGSHVDVAVSVDGTWQKRGYASLNGAVTVIGLDNGKCLAYDCMAKSCKSCQAWENKKKILLIMKNLFGLVSALLTTLGQLVKWKLMVLSDVLRSLWLQMAYNTQPTLAMEIRRLIHQWLLQTHILE